MTTEGTTRTIHGSLDDRRHMSTYTADLERTIEALIREKKALEQRAAKLEGTIRGTRRILQFMKKKYFALREKHNEPFEHIPNR